MSSSQLPSPPPTKPPTPKAKVETPATVSDADLEKLLNREASAFQREIEVERILKAFKFKYVSNLTVSQQE